MAVKLNEIPFHSTDWAAIAAMRHADETGAATWRTREVGHIRLRMPEYSPGLPGGPLAPERPDVPGARGRARDRARRRATLSPRPGDIGAAPFWAIVIEHV
jgi:hypothetical protein